MCLDKQREDCILKEKWVGFSYSNFTNNEDITEKESLVSPKVVFGVEQKVAIFSILPFNGV